MPVQSAVGGDRRQIVILAFEVNRCPGIPVSVLAFDSRHVHRSLRGKPSEQPVPRSAQPLRQTWDRSRRTGCLTQQEAEPLSSWAVKGLDLNCGVRIKVADHNAEDIRCTIIKILRRWIEPDTDEAGTAILFSPCYIVSSQVAGIDAPVGRQQSRKRTSADGDVMSSVLAFVRHRVRDRRLPINVRQVA